MGRDEVTDIAPGDLSLAFEDGECLLDWIEVWRVARQCQHCMPCGFQELGDFRFIVERCVIHNHQTVGPQGGQQHFFDPGGDGQMRATGFKEHWCEPVGPALRHDQIGALTVVAADLAQYLPATAGPTMGTVAMAGKTALVKIDHIGLAVFGDPKAQTAQK